MPAALDWATAPFAELDGYEAFVAGELRDANPHRPGSDEYDAWLRGWDCAEYDHGG